MVSTTGLRSGATVTKVMIVDDQEIDLIVEQAVLVRCGFEVHTTTDGRDALRKIVEHEIEVVVTDLHMPGIHGFELITLLRDLSPSRP